MFSSRPPTSKRFEQKSSFFLTDRSVHVKAQCHLLLTCFSWLAFFPISTYISSSNMEFYVIAFMFLCNSGTVTEIQVHMSEESLCFQILNAKHHLPSCENIKAAISQHVLGVSMVGSPLQFYL